MHPQGASNINCSGRAGDEAKKRKLISRQKLESWHR